MTSVILSPETADVPLTFRTERPERKDIAARIGLDAFSLFG